MAATPTTPPPAVPEAPAPSGQRNVVTGERDPDATRRSFRETLAEYLDRRLLTVFIFGIASGFPWVLWGSAMTAWLKESGLTRSAIGVFGTVAAAYSVHFLWAPFVDRIPFPVLGPAGTTARLDPRHADHPLPGHPGHLVHAPGGEREVDERPGPDHRFASATQDVAIDAYRVEIIPREEPTKIAHASATTTAGWWTGYALLGAIPSSWPTCPAGPGAASTCCWPPCGSRS
jgi:PAT family beta-lactamase induction signal transducer AmpG